MQNLQIGNLINPDFPMKVTLVGPNYVHATFEGNEGDDYEFEGVDIKPVPLSHEILTSFSGVKFLSNGLYNTYVLPNGTYVFTPEKDLLYEKVGFYYIGNFETMRLALQYVHELQNFYLLLTKQPLEWKI